MKSFEQISCKVDSKVEGLQIPISIENLKRGIKVIHKIYKFFKNLQENQILQIYMTAIILYENNIF